MAKTKEELDVEIAFERKVYKLLREASADQGRKLVALLNERRDLGD